jgi:hypothetical protein
LRFLFLGPLKVIDGDRTVVLGGRPQCTALAGVGQDELIASQL